MGNPTLGEIKTMVIGVRNVSGEIKSGEKSISSVSADASTRKESL